MQRLIDDPAYLRALWEDGRFSQLKFERNLSPLEEWLIDKLIETGADCCKDLENQIGDLEDEIEDLKCENWRLQNDLDDALNELEDLRSEQ